MANLRIMSDNAADRATLSASSTNGALAVTNLLSDKKSSVWQAVGTSARLGATWTSPEAIQGVAAPFCNWSPTATWRVRLTSEAQATNLIPGSETLSAANGWSGCTLSSSAANYQGFVPYQTVAKALTSSSESRNCGIGLVTSGQTVTLTIAVRSGTTTAAGLGLFDNVAAWGANSASTASVLLGPGVLAQGAGGLWNVSGLSATADTLIQITRTYAVASSASVSIYPGTSNSTTSGASILATRLMCENGPAATSYYPTTSAAATRPLGYIDAWQSYSYDSGSVLTCLAAAIVLRGWTAAQSANAYAYGGGACARLWLPSSVSAYGMALDIVDTNNLQGNIEAARIVCGPYWSPTYNTTTLSETYVDGAIHTRTDAGDLWSDASTIHKKVPIDLEYMPATDRTTLANILRASRAYPIFLSAFPGISDLELERAHTVYGKRMSDSEVAVQAAIMYGTKIEVESI